MAQATSPDYDQSQEDPSLSEDQTQGKTSLFGKLKNKTKDHTHKLKEKLKPSSKTGDDATDEDFSAASGNEEVETPVDNAVSGVTQPEYAQKSSDETAVESQAKGSAAKPTENFPGSFTDIANDRTEAEANADDSGLSKDFQGLSTNDKSESVDTPMTEKIQEKVGSAKDKTKDTLTPPGGDSEQQQASPDAPPAAEQAQQVGDKVTEAGKSWTQWAAEKVGYAKDTAAANAPTTAEGKPYHEEAMGAAVGAKDTVIEKAAAAKDSLAAQMPDPSSFPSDPAQQTYVQRATGGIYGAKDKLFTSTQPGEDDKALSQKVTETVGNLPTTLKSSLGFGGKTSGSSFPTTTPASSDAPLSSPSEEAEGASPQSPGLVSRITGLFGGKKSATESTSPSSEPAISESGPEMETKISES